MQLGWTWHYLHECIPWAVVQKLTADQLQYETEDEVETIKLNDDNVKGLLGNYIMDK